MIETVIRDRRSSLLGDIKNMSAHFSFARGSPPRQVGDEILFTREKSNVLLLIFNNISDMYQTLIIKFYKGFATNF